MHNKLAVIICSILGATLLYCGQSAMNDPRDGGVLADLFAGDAVRDAGASGGAVCCTTPHSFTKVAEGSVAARATTGTYKVGAFREVVIYMNPPQASAGEILFFPDEQSDRFLVVSGERRAAGRITVEGPVLKIRNTSDAPANFYLAGVQ